jgi:trehalose monomycolate/heme transporter
MKRWAELVTRRAGLLVVLFTCATAALGVYGAGVYDSLSAGGFDDPGSESAHAAATERDVFGNRSADVSALYSSPSVPANSPAVEAEVRRIVGQLDRDAVSSVLTYYDTGDPRLLSENGRITQVIVSLAGDSQDAKMSNYERIEGQLRSAEMTTQLTGIWPVYADAQEMSDADAKRAEAYSLPVVIALCLLIFGSLVAALMPAVIGVVAIVGAMTSVRMLTQFTEVSIFSVNIITLLGLGLAVDYALFVVSRFREELATADGDDNHAVPAAVHRTMATAGRTVLFSGLTVAAALSSLLLFPQIYLRSMAYGGIAAVLVAMIAALSVLPAALTLLGRKIDAGRIIRRRPPEPGRWWATWVRAVMRRPVVTLLGVLVVLGTLGWPFLSSSWGAIDYRVLPPDAPAHRAADTLTQEFGGEISTASVVLQGADDREAAAFNNSLATVPQVVEVRPVAVDGDQRLLQVQWNDNSQSEASRAVVEQLRGIDPPGDSTALVGGTTAETVDLLDSLSRTLPWMAAFASLVMLVLLFLAFGSIILPLKAVLMNAASITASFGVVTWIFADGHLQGLLRFESQGFLDATQPVVMLAVLFGLSMDYEVFLLSRIHEQWRLTGDNAHSVAAGVQLTGRIITNAALLLAVVIGAFSISGLVFMKLIGVGMMAALIIDATLVRAVLVPATMALLGKWNWWAPPPLRRIWERYRLQPEASGYLPQQAGEPASASSAR